MVYVRTVRDHKRTAPKMSALRQSLSSVSGEIYGRYPVAHATNRIVIQLNNLISKLSSALDDDLHSLLTDEEGRGDLGKMYYEVAPPPLTPPRGAGAPLNPPVRKSMDSDSSDDSTDSEEGGLGGRQPPLGGLGGRSPLPPLLIRKSL